MMQHHDAGAREPTAALPSWSTRTSPPMTTSTMTLLFATLAILAAAAAVVLHAVRWLPFPEARQRLGELLDGQEIPLAFVVATVATLGSLYLSEVANFVPCRLCWYQRIAMYPLPVLLGVAWWKRDDGVRRYALPLAIIGMCHQHLPHPRRALPVARGVRRLRGRQPVLGALGGALRVHHHPDHGPGRVRADQRPPRLPGPQTPPSGAGRPPRPTDRIGDPTVSPSQKTSRPPAAPTGRAASRPPGDGSRWWRSSSSSSPSSSSALLPSPQLGGDDTDDQPTTSGRRRGPARHRDGRPAHRVPGQRRRRPVRRGRRAGARREGLRRHAPVDRRRHRPAQPRGVRRPLVPALPGRGPAARGVAGRRDDPRGHRPRRRLHRRGVGPPQLPAVVVAGRGGMAGRDHRRRRRRHARPGCTA